MYIVVVSNGMMVSGIVKLDQMIHYLKFRSQHGSVGIMTRPRASKSGILIPTEKKTLFSKLSRPSLGPTHPPNKWVPTSFPQSKAAEACT